jgi:hypothetical protein
MQPATGLPLEVPDSHHEVMPCNRLIDWLGGEETLGKPGDVAP